MTGGGVGMAAEKMEKNRNYSKELEEILCKPDWKGKTLLLHSCCAPCSSYVLEYLRNFFRITVFFYNPNILSGEEYTKRKEEQKRLLEIMNRPGERKGGYPLEYLEGNYEPACFLERVRGLEQCAEGGERCFLCYEQRLRESAVKAKAYGMDCFTTTLTVSPLKNAEKLNEIGRRTGEEAGVLFLPSDFKKKEGYKRSVQLSKEYGLYRQNYCGCVYSRDFVK